MRPLVHAAAVLATVLVLDPARFPQASVGPPAPLGPVPTTRQLAWHDLQFYGFLHFSVNTFTDREWGFGDEPASTFAPTALDARQWARVAKDGGLQGLILTCKHHDGFCLWPSRFTDHSVRHSPGKPGRAMWCGNYHTPAGRSA